VKLDGPHAVCVNQPHDFTDELIAVGGGENRNADSNQRTFFGAGQKLCFAVGGKPPKVRRRPCKGECGKSFSREIDFTFPVVEFHRRFCASGR
jgi:hypothetical protein